MGLVPYLCSLGLGPAAAGCSRIDHPWPCSSLICSRRRRTQGSVRPGLTRGMAPAGKRRGVSRRRAVAQYLARKDMHLTADFP